MIVFHEYMVPEFRAYLQGYRDRGAVLKATFLHHTWTSSSAFCGLATMESFRYGHMHRRQPMHDIACGAYATPQGTVFNGRPPTSNNCACQAPEKGVELGELPPELRRLVQSGGCSWRSWPNMFGFGVETVGNFDNPAAKAPPSENPLTSVAIATSLDVLAIVHELWEIPPEHCFFHRDVSSKSCPGNRVSRDWVHSELRRRLAVADDNRPDVSDWAAPSVARVKDLGLMTGYPDGTFGGGKPMMREEFAVVLCRLLNLEVD